MNKIEIIRDTKEKVDYWNFHPSKYCLGTTSEHLDTADYSIRGLENIISIERKKNSGELAGNVFTKRFVNELIRGQSLKYFYIVCEFTLEDLFRFPYNSGIPKPIWKKLRINANSLVRRVFELEIKYNAHFIFAGDKGKEVSLSIFKQVAAIHSGEF